MTGRAIRIQRGVRHGVICPTGRMGSASHERHGDAPAVSSPGDSGSRGSPSESHSLPTGLINAHHQWHTPANGRDRTWFRSSVEHRLVGRVGRLLQPRADSLDCLVRRLHPVGPPAPRTVDRAVACPARSDVPPHVADSGCHGLAGRGELIGAAQRLRPRAFSIPGGGWCKLATSADAHASATLTQLVVGTTGAKAAQAGNWPCPSRASWLAAAPWPHLCDSRQSVPHLIRIRPRCSAGVQPRSAATGKEPGFSHWPRSRSA